jgi:ClpP class serine protease
MAVGSGHLCEYRDPEQLDAGHVNRFVSSLIASPLLLEPTWGRQAMPLLEKFLGKETTKADAEPLPEPYCLLPGDVQMAGKVVFSESGGQLTSGSVAVMEITGPIWKYGSWWSYGSMDYVATLESLLATPEIGAIVLVVDSPGGQASGIATLYDTIRTATKPILVLINGLAASAAYYAIAGATEIWASQGADQIGSIGVYITLLDASGYYAQMGLKLIEVYSRLSTQKNIEARQALSGDLAAMQDMLDGLVTYFHEAVKTSRPQLNFDLADPTLGGVFFADKAKDMGLIDEIGSFRQVLTRAFDLATNNSQSDSSMKLFNKFPALTLLAGVAASAISDEQVVAANENLEQQGIEGVVALRTSDVEAYAALETENTRLTTENGTLTTNLATANAEIARLGTQPGAKPTAVVKPVEEQPQSTTTEQPSFYSESDKLLAQIKNGLK